jgi:hypothetical protein
VVQAVSAAPKRAHHPGPAGWRHIAAAAILAAIILAIYGVIAWGMFIGSEDYKAHVILAQRSYEGGKPVVPHFLFHGLTAVLFAAHLAPTFTRAARYIMAGCYLAIPLLLYGVLWREFRETRIARPGILFVAGLAILMAAPITLSRAYALGYFWPEPYQIPTSTLLKPFALIGFIFAARCLTRPEIRGTSIALFAATTMAGSLSKPSYLICAIPAVSGIAAYRTIRRLPMSPPALLLGLYIPAALVLGWQYYAAYSGVLAGAYRDSIDWAPFRFMSYWATDLLTKLLLSIAFPLAVTALHWNQARHDPMLQLAWSIFFFGAFYSYMLAEHIHWRDGNFTWSGHIAAFLLIAACVMFLLRCLLVLSPTRGAKLRTAICALVLAVHVFSGARMDWIYLTHYGCPIDYGRAELVCHN